MAEHLLYKDGDANIPDAIKDRNGQVALSQCKVCGKAEAELDQPCNPTIKEAKMIIRETYRPLDVKEIRKINMERCLLWHKGGIEEWSPAMWTNALIGEVGELGDEIKKLLRLEMGMVQANGPADKMTSVHSIGMEIADCYFYLDLVLARYGLRMEDALKDAYYINGDLFYYNLNAIRTLTLQYTKAWFSGRELYRLNPSEWSVRLAMEVGKLAGIVFGEIVHERAEPAAIAHRCGRIFRALDTLAARLDICLSVVLREKFNAVSERNGFPQRL